MILKGGSLLLIKTKTNQFRVTKDIDLNAVNLSEKDDIMKAISEISEEGCDDGIYFDKNSIDISSLRGLINGYTVKVKGHFYQLIAIM